MDNDLVTYVQRVSKVFFNGTSRIVVGHFIYVS